MPSPNSISHISSWLPLFISPGLHCSRPTSAHMATTNRSAVVVRFSESAMAVPALSTRTKKPKTKTKIKQDKYWKKIREYAITQFPRLMNDEERLMDRENNLFKGILIKTQSIENSPCREIRKSHEKRLAGRSQSRFNALNQTRTDPVLTRANSRAKSVVQDATANTHSSSSRRETSRPKPGAIRSTCSLVTQPKTRAAVRATALLATALGQCRDCSVVLTRIDTTFGVKYAAPNVTSTVPLGSTACATARAKRATCRLTLNSSIVAPRVVSLIKSGANKVTSTASPGCVIQAASRVAESATVACLNTSPIVTQPRTRAAVRATALTEIVIGKCRDCRVLLRRIDSTTTGFRIATPKVTSAAPLGSTSCANSRRKSALPDVNVNTETWNSNTRVTRAKASAAHSTSSLIIQPKTRATARATDFTFWYGG